MRLYKILSVQETIVDFPSSRAMFIAYFQLLVASDVSFCFSFSLLAGRGKLYTDGYLLESLNDDCNNFVQSDLYNETPHDHLLPRSSQNELGINIRFYSCVDHIQDFHYDAQSSTTFLLASRYPKERHVTALKVTQGQMMFYCNYNPDVRAAVCRGDDDPGKSINLSELPGLLKDIQGDPRYIDIFKVEELNVELTGSKRRLGDLDLSGFSHLEIGSLHRGYDSDDCAFEFTQYSECDTEVDPLVFPTQEFKRLKETHAF